MKKKKGFTLIELLAVIIILGVLMIIAIPSVTDYIQNSRKQAYVTIAKRYIDGATAKVNSGEIPMYDVETTYYMPSSCISLEKGGESPFGEWKEAYIVVTYDGDGFDYYWTSYDSSNMGIVLTYRDLLEPKYVEPGITSIDTSIGVGERNDILVIKEDCDINNAEHKNSIENIREHGRYTNAMHVTNLEELQEAFANPKILNIFLENNIEIDKILPVEISSDQEERIIRINGNGNTITYKDGYSDTLFNIPVNVSMRFDDVTFDGKNIWTFEENPTTGDGWYASYINSNGREITDYMFTNQGALSLGNNVTIKNIIFDSGQTGYNNDLGVIKSTSGKVVLDGVVISNCAGLSLNAVNSTVEIKGNTVITDNLGTGNKGGIFIINNSNAKLSENALINNNKTIIRSGAVFGLVNGSDLIIDGGKITNNTVLSPGSNTAGAMIVLESGSAMTMNSGEITGNKGALSGAIASRWNSGSYGTSSGIFLNGGIIRENTTIKSSWNNSEVFLRSAATIGENMTIDGVVVVNSDGVLTNNGNINGNLILSHTTAVAENNGTVNGDVTITVTGATFNNNKTVTGTITNP